MSSLVVRDSGDIEITKDLMRSPFSVIFVEALEGANVQTLKDKSNFLVNLERELLELENHSESEAAKNHWLSIVCGFGAALTIAGSAALVPPFGMMFSGVAIAGAINTVYTSVTTNATTSPIIETLKRHRLALASEEALQWATLWQYTDTEILCKSLAVASDGYITGNGSLVHKNGDSPLFKAIDYVARSQGLSFDELMTRLKKLKANEHIVESHVTLPVSSIGASTRLNAVEVEVVTLQNWDTSFETKTEIGLPIELMQNMVNAPYSTFVIGMSGAGKDILVYNVVSELRKKHPTACLIGIDGKNAPEEKELWSKPLYDHTIHFSMGDSPKKYHQKLLDIFEKIDTLPPFTFIVFSELNGTRDSYISNGMSEEWQAIANKIRYIALQLNYAQKYIIATAQTANKEELGIGAGRQNVRFCLVANGQQQSFINAVVKAAVFDGDVKDKNAYSSAINKSQAIEHLPNATELQGIAYFHSSLGKWNPMPRLLNAGSDRGQMAKPPFQPKAITSSQDLERIYNQPSSQGIEDLTEEETVTEAVSSLANIQEAYPQWTPKTQQLASKVVDWLSDKTDKSYTPSEVKKNIRLLKDNDKLPTEKVKKLLDVLAESNFLSSDETGRYSISQTATDDDYNF